MCSKVNLEFLKELATKVYKKISPLVGTDEAGTLYNRGKGGDISMKIDIVAEEIIIESLKTANVNVLLISEEIGEKYIGNRKEIERLNSKLIVDPVDGSTNSVRGIPFCSVSLAYAEGNDLDNIITTVIINLTTGEMFWAQKGKGAFFNGNKIKVSNIDPTENLIFEIDTSLENLFQELKKYYNILKDLHKVRVMGSLALSLCLLAKGAIDGYLNLRKGTRIVDMAAGYLIIKEAGGKVFSMSGEDLRSELSLNAKIPLAACNSHLESYLREKLRQIHDSSN